MREKPIGVVLTVLAVLAVGAAPAAFVALDAGTAARPERAAVSDKPHLSEQSRRDRAQSYSCGAGETRAPLEPGACACVPR